VLDAILSLEGRIAMENWTPEDLVWAKEIASAVWRGAEVLDDRAMFILSLRFGLAGNGEHTYKEIAEICGRSIERVRQTCLIALRRLSRKDIIRAAGDDVGCEIPPRKEFVRLSECDNPW
jgi:DNA-directed RNA polymerase sigma subunit (sigma70/sigma32)